MKPTPERSIYGQALSISLAVVPFGVAFGVLCRQAGFHVLEAAGFSALVFSGSAQFAAAGVLNDGGSVAASFSDGSVRVWRADGALAHVLRFEGAALHLYR